MAKKELRKVAFAIGYRNGYNPDMTDEKLKEELERTRERAGFFHKWVEESDIIPQTDAAYTKTLALIEDAETGNMYKVEPDLVIFKS